jgi:serine/threonine protein kinase
MELLEGESLSDFIKKHGALSEQLVYDLMTKMLKAFGYAHSKGLIHRDVKPANIFITNDKNIKILDFGIAKLIGQDAELTGTGMQMGTPMYMSPEQVKDSKHLDKRSDIYSLGVLMFYMLAGKTPYDASTNSNFDILNKIVNGSLSLDAIPDRFIPVVKKATEKLPEKRFQSCEEFYKGLKESITEKDPDGPLTTSSSSNNGWIFFLVISLVFSIVISVSLYSDLKMKYKNLFSEFNDLEKSKADMENTNTELNEKLNVLNDKIGKIGQVYPIVITDMKIGNIDNESKIIDDFGSTLYAKTIKYLSPKIYFIPVKTGTIEYKLKIYEPNGLSQGKSSPEGYTYIHKLYVDENKNEVKLAGWGNKKGGTYDSGYHRIEVWYDDGDKDRLLYSKSFYLY